MLCDGAGRLQRFPSLSLLTGSKTGQRHFATGETYYELLDQESWGLTMDFPAVMALLSEGVK
jgi:hypothetical protein